jgi:hypothetical protein
MARPTKRADRVAKVRPLVERIRKICLALPEANERLSHGEATFFAGTGKVFAMLDTFHHGSEHLSVHLPQPPGVQQLLVGLVRDAYVHVASAKLRALLEV